MTTRPSRAFRRLAVVTAALTYMLIVVGGVVRVTGSGDGCGSSGGWPLCNGSLLPALRTTTLIEFSHRWITTIATVLIVALVITAWVSVRRYRRLVVASTLAGVLLVLQIALGALVVEFDLPGGIVLVHLANALLLLGVLVYVAVMANTLGTEAESRALGLARAVRLTTIAAGATYVLALSGALVVETKSSAGCNGWPLCGGGFQLPAAQMDVINVTHRLVAGVAVVLIGVVMGMLLRRFRGDGALRRAALVVNVVLLAQIAAGALVVVLRLPSGVQALHLALASLLWATIVGVAVLTRARVEATAPAPAETEPGVSLPRPARVASA